MRVLCALVVASLFDIGSCGAPRSTYLAARIGLGSRPHYEYDVVRGYSFSHPILGTVQPGVRAVGFNDSRIKKTHYPITSGHMYDYTLCNVCSDYCDKFVPSSDYNGTNCNAWAFKVLAYAETLSGGVATYECILYEYTDYGIHNGVDASEICPGCAAGVEHITYPDNQEAVTAFYLSLVGAHLLLTLYVAWSHRKDVPLTECIMTQLEVFVPTFFAVLEMADSACSSTQEFNLAILGYFILAHIPSMIKARVERHLLVAEQRVLEVLHHSGHGNHHHTNTDGGNAKGVAAHENRGASSGAAIYEDDEVQDDGEGKMLASINNSNSHSSSSTNAAAAGDDDVPLIAGSSSAKHQENPTASSVSLITACAALEEADEKSESFEALYVLIVEVIKRLTRFSSYMLRRGKRGFFQTAWVHFKAELRQASKAKGAFRKIRKIVWNRSTIVLYCIVYQWYFMVSVGKLYGSGTAHHVTCQPLVPFLQFGDKSAD